MRRKLDHYLAKERVKSSSYIARLNRNSDRPHLQNWLDDLVWAPGKGGLGS